MIKRERAYQCLLLSFLLSSILPGAVAAKVGDPPPVQNGDVIYSSHYHTVTAINTQANKKVWEKSIPMAEYRKQFNPKKERDAQLNIIESLKAEGDRIVVTNSKGETFYLEKRTGKQVQTTRK